MPVSSERNVPTIVSPAFLGSHDSGSGCSSLASRSSAAGVPGCWTVWPCCETGIVLYLLLDVRGRNGRPPGHLEPGGRSFALATLLFCLLPDMPRFGDGDD